MRLNFIYFSLLFSRSFHGTVFLFFFFLYTVHAPRTAGNREPWCIHQLRTSNPSKCQQHFQAVYEGSFILSVAAKKCSPPWLQPMLWNVATVTMCSYWTNCSCICAKMHFINHIIEIRNSILVGTKSSEWRNWRLKNSVSMIDLKEKKTLTKQICLDNV